MRLIEADKTIELLKARLYETALNNSTVNCDASQLYKECADNRIEVWINEIPTVDAEPIKYGHWEDTTVLFYRGCSECGCYIKWKYEPFLDIGGYNYCPNCGAKMDGGDL